VTTILARLLIAKVSEDRGKAREGEGGGEEAIN